MGTTHDSTRADHKQEMRRIFHGQLKRFWAVNKFLSSWIGADADQPRLSKTEELANRYASNGYRWVPLVTPEMSLFCSLSILLLRPGVPGGGLRGSDTTNRLKTLFDALRMPRTANELGQYALPGVDEDPFFVLLADDNLVTDVSVETDLLLEPVGIYPTRHDARLVVTVSLRPDVASKENAGFA